MEKRGEENYFIITRHVYLLKKILPFLIKYQQQQVQYVKYHVSTQSDRREAAIVGANECDVKMGGVEHVQFMKKLDDIDEDQE